MNNEIRNGLKKVKLSYTKTVTYHKDDQILTKYEPEVFESWLEEIEFHHNQINQFGSDEDFEILGVNIEDILGQWNQNDQDWGEVITKIKKVGSEWTQTSNNFGEGPFDQSIQMWMDKKKIESLTQQVESLTQKLESSTS